MGYVTAKYGKSVQKDKDGAIQRKIMWVICLEVCWAYSQRGWVYLGSIHCLVFYK